MSIYVGTPTYGGNCTTPCVMSLLTLQDAFIKQGVLYDINLNMNESLITRGRNVIASDFYFNTNHEVLMFIDADIQFTPEDVSKLWNMDQNISVGAYSRKKKGSYTTVWKNGEEVDIKKLKTITKVDVAGTGFMMIKRDVFTKLKRPEWERRNGEIIAWFQDDGCDESEDYFFCNRAKEAGYDIMLDPTIKLTHFGMYGYGED